MNECLIEKIRLEIKDPLKKRTIRKTHKLYSIKILFGTN